jgi:hypothetical protein
MRSCRNHAITLSDQPSTFGQAIQNRHFLSNFHAWTVARSCAWATTNGFHMPRISLNPMYGRRGILRFASHRKGSGTSPRSL